MADHFAQLDKDTQAAVMRVIEMARRSPGRHSIDHGTGDVYAYPHPGGGIAWGWNTKYGCAERGVLQ